MEKSITSMNLAELVAYCVKHKITPRATGSNEKYLKRDYIEAIKLYQEEINATRIKQIEDDASKINSILFSLQGRIDMYMLELNVSRDKLSSVIHALIDAKNKGDLILPEQVRFILRECKFFQERGCKDFDHMIISLQDLLVEDSIL